MENERSLTERFAAIESKLADSKVLLELGKANELPFFILELKSGKIGTHSITDAGVSSSINFINKENLLTSTAWTSISTP